MSIEEGSPESGTVEESGLKFEPVEERSPEPKTVEKGSPVLNPPPFKLQLFSKSPLYIHITCVPFVQFEQTKMEFIMFSWRKLSFKVSASLLKPCRPESNLKILEEYHH